MKHSASLSLCGILLLALTAGCLGNGQDPGTTPSTNTAGEKMCPHGEVGVGNGTVHVVNITGTGFQPETVTIQQGDTVKFVNRDTDPHWPASNIHPTHQQYPGSGSIKCGSDEQQCIFDACNGLEQGESFTYTFREPGEWGYHDHQYYDQMGEGTVIVE